MSMFRLLRADEIDARIGMMKPTGASLLLYKDARCDMAILDETVGAFNWKREHSRDNANCTVSLWDNEKKQWVSKEDTGTESNTEAEKGLASDSFKRACFNWGIGRELYTSPFIWVSGKPEDLKSAKFKVDAIGYDENRNINYLVISDGKTGNVVYSFGKGAPAAISLVKKPSYKVDESEPAFDVCEECGRPIKDVYTKSGTQLTAKQLIDGSKKAYGVCLCYECASARKASKA